MIPKKLIEEIERWISGRKYGNLQINFADGKIVNVNKVESVKVEFLVVNSPDTKIEAKAATSFDI